MFNEKRYLEKVSQLKHTYNSTIDFKGNEGYMRNYFLTRANLFHLAPELVKKSDYFEFFKNILMYQSWSGIDEKEFDFATEADLEGCLDFLVDIDHKPRVFCTYHLGSYRILNLILTHLGINFSLVVDNQTVETQGEKFYSLIDGFKKHTNPKVNNEFKILNAESPTIGIQMMRELKSGRSLVFYIDGNTGIGGVHRHDDKLTKINFLGKRFFARKGISFISHATQTPIIPVMNYRVNDSEVKVKFCHPIIPEKATNREDYCRETTQHIYDTFTDFLRKYPEQWEGWLYVHKYIDIESVTKNLDDNVSKTSIMPFSELSNTAKVSFNHQRFGIFGIKEQYYIFDRNTYLSHNVPSGMNHVLGKINELKTVSKQATLEIFGSNETPINYLLSKNILVAI